MSKFIHPGKIQPGEKKHKIKKIAKVAEQIQYFNPSLTFENEKDQLRVDIRIFQRSARKYLTTIEGLPPSTQAYPNLDALVRKIKTTANCSGTIKKGKDDRNKLVLQFSGDKRDFIQQFLVENGICGPNDITKHGF